MMKFTVISLGCKVNQFEAQALGQMMTERGWQRCAAEEGMADAVLIFTCCVTNKAATKSRKTLYHYRRLNPKAIMIMVGCYVQVDSASILGADLLVGSSLYTKIPDLIEQYQKDHQARVVMPSWKDITFEDAVPDIFTEQTRAYLKVQDGCNQYCSYCIIPYARGKERSMPLEEAVAQAGRLSKKHHEIVLTGIHTGRYGYGKGYTLADLIERILEQTDIQRLRISSIEMNEVDAHFIRLLQNPRLGRHVHMPLQAGCDRILERMHRPYDTKQYLHKVEEIRKAVPDISLSTDLIVGFPGESDADFTQTLAFIDQCAFSFLHVFPFSRRKGTQADIMKEQVNEAVKKRRVHLAMEKSEYLYDAFKRRQIGKISSVLMEKAHETYTPGHSLEYVEVHVPGVWKRGEIFPVRIKKLVDHQLIGEVEMGT